MKARPLSHSASTVSVLAAAVLTAMAAAPAQAADSCMARSAATAVPVVELYTSEGCSSCPPADRWLSRLKNDPAVVALAFHVDYWDRLGWKDRFASPAFTERQVQQQTINGARFSYTPQVVVDGVDQRNWPAVNAAALARTPRPAPVDVVLAREGPALVATVAAGRGSPKRLAAYWAVTEQDHASSVKAGENQGVVLRHDLVVRDYRPVAPWPARSDAPQTLRFTPAATADPGHPRQVNLVVVDADSGRPVQAVKLGC